MGRVIVVGSVNVDLVVRVARLPEPGVTVSGGELARHQGGKGGNQAVAAARLGASVVFVGAVGRDELGESALAALAAEGIEVSEVARVDGPTGVALIVVGESGQNQIAIAPGANSTLDEMTVRATLERLRVAGGDVVLASCEVPAGAVHAALAAGRTAGAATILNPAPADGLDRSTRRLADVLTPNETELLLISGTSSPTQAAALLLEDGGTRWLAVTQGAAGATLAERNGATITLPAPAVKPVDTTGAGDAFNGALGAFLSDGRAIGESVGLAVAAASLSTEQAGARVGMPTATELEAFSSRGRA